ncbi:hypothetical protein [Edaphosphingomonas haloaromaticamans]|uniref:GAF domain-containing protein n=1 Tax=Edaphosphingomonas haloaromaticamans TaxID=653954 RepID=A0A1S1HAU9_9SPHN|nr:hypothetical protein [Sphingomonas haloaromaticamans]OHT18561.1 hypothetical protein BHE75_00535 [Sphingomonas haloaromaticamans]
MNRTAANIRLLCSLGLDRRVVAPMLMQELRQLIGFDSALFLRLGPHGIVDAFADRPEAQTAAPLYAREYFAKREADVVSTLPEAVATQFGPRRLRECIKVDERAFYASEFYNELLRPSEVHFAMRGILRLGADAIGGLALFRTRKDRDFGDRDIARWQDLERHLAFALSHEIDEGATPDEALLSWSSRGPAGSDGRRPRRAGRSRRRGFRSTAPRSGTRRPSLPVGWLAPATTKPGARNWIFRDLKACYYACARRGSIPPTRRGR